MDQFSVLHLAFLTGGGELTTSDNNAEHFTGWRGGGCGETSVELALLEKTARLRVQSRWMGSDPLDVVLHGGHQRMDSHYGALVLEGAHPPNKATPVAVPPSEGPITIEYVRVPIQQDRYAGNPSMAIAGDWNRSFTLVLWLHSDATFDDGTDLEPDEYDPPVEAFRPVVRALNRITQPWKLGEIDEGSED